MKRYLDYNTVLRERYGKKTVKIPVNLPVTCPNRDGTVGTGGCSFCGSCPSSNDSALPVREQLRKNKEYMREAYKAEAFIAYLQDFTNTYLPADAFERVLYECDDPDVVAVDVSTRPDCIHETYLTIADTFRRKTGKDVYFEIGLQSVNPHTLRDVHRGHTVSQAVNAILKIKEHGFYVGVHLIPNLPQEQDIDTVEAAQLMSVLHVDSVKLHNLYILPDTALGKDYADRKFSMGEPEDYFVRVALFLKHLAPDIAVERFFARCPEPGCLFSNWGRSWKYLQNELIRYLDTYDVVQGSESPLLDGIEKQ